MTGSEPYKKDAALPANLLERARRLGNPVIEGNDAWFVWQGEKPVELNGDFSDWKVERNIPLQPAGENLWAACLEFRPDAYIEYGFFDGGKQRIDPFNLRLTPNGLGQTNHFFYMPEGHPTPLILRRPGIPAGKLTQHKLDTGEYLTGPKRTISLYQPAVDAACPLLVIYDGEDYLKIGKVTTQAENLVSQGRMQPVALAFVPPNPPTRTLEYACNDVTLGFVVEKVLPLARKQLRLVDPASQPGAWGVIGASMGGLMALYTAMRMPEIFGMALSQSGAFLSLGGPEPLIFDLVEHSPAHPLRIWIDVGIYEWLLPDNQAMRSRLERKGYAVGYKEFSGGHNYPSWRNDLHYGLEWLLPAGNGRLPG